METSPNKRELAEQLREHVVQESYSQAVKLTRDLCGSGDGSIVTNTVLRLAREGEMKLLSYVYQLWTGGERATVAQYLPKTFEMLFGDWVVLVQKEYGLALKMDANTDRDGDRIVWGDSSDKTSRRVHWKLLPFWEDNRVYFKIQDMDRGMFLKLEVRPDGIGDRGAFGATQNDTNRHLWFLEPVVIGREILFYIINRQYDQGLKLQMSTDSMGDRKLWGHAGCVHHNPKHFAWAIHRSAFI